MSFTPPRISVVIAAYNHAPYLSRCLHSVLEQSFQDFELIVTDDGSQDDTLAVLERHADDSRLSWSVFPHNRGACIALNHGLRQARGEYIAILNSDDFFLPGKLEKQVAFLDAHAGIGAVFGYPKVVDEREQPFTDAAHKDFAVFFVPNRSRTAWLRHFFEYGNCLCHPTLMIRKSCYDRVGLYDARLAQVPDLDLWMRLCRHFDIHVLPEPLTAFRIRDNLANASAARPEVIVRDAFERRHLLRHYLGWSPEFMAEVFPEFAGYSLSPDEFIAHHALSLGMPFFTQFGLDVLFHGLPPDGDGGAYREFIALSGR